MKILKTLLVMAVSVAFALSFVSFATAAEDNSNASGTCGTCDWVIDSDGVLTISGGELGEWGDMPPWHEYKDQITAVKATDTVVLTTAARMFEECGEMKAADITGFDFSNVTDTHFMFRLCHSLVELKTSGFNAQNLLNIQGMFDDCNSLESLDLSGLDTSQVTDMSGLFSGCASLKSLDISGLDTSKVTDTNCMFSNCRSLKSLDLSNIDTSHVIYMNQMFASCENLKTIDLSQLSTARVKQLSGLFSGCSSLESIDLSQLNITNVTDLSELFCGCSALESLDLSDLDTSKVTNMRQMFAGVSVPVLDLSPLDTSRVTNMRGMFAGVKSDVLILPNLDTSNVLDMTEMFSYCKVPDLDLSNLVIPDNAVLTNMFQGVNKIKTGNWVETANRPVLPAPMTDTTTMIKYEKGDVFPPVNGHTFVLSRDTTGGYTITNVTLNKTTLEWGETLEVAVDYIGTEPVIHSTCDFLHSEFSRRAHTPDMPYGYSGYAFGADQCHDSFDSASGTGTYTIKTKISCMQQIGNYPTFRIHLFGLHSSSDILDGAEFVNLYELEIKAPHRDAAFDTNYADEGLYDALNHLQDGDSAILRCEILPDSMIPREKWIENIQGLEYSLVKSEYYNAIKGRDITLIIPTYTDSYMEINGMDVGENIEDVYIATSPDVSIRCEPNAEGSFDIEIFQGFPNNGILPAKTTYRFSKTRWTDHLEWDLKEEYDVANSNQIIEDFFNNALLYYLKNTQTAVKDGKYEQDGNWVVMTLDHNSDYVLTNSDPKKIRTFNASISKKNFTYNGKVQKPTVKLKTINGYGGKSDHSFVFSNSKSKNVGTYTVTIKPKTRGFGKQSFKYRIYPRSTSISKLSPIHKGFKVYIKKYTAQTTGYQIRYSTKSSMSGAKKVTIKSNKTTTKTIKKLKAKKKYYVQVRTFKTVKGTKYYSSWSKKKAVKTKK